MPNETNRQSIRDEEHLKLLSLGYWLTGGYSAMMAALGLMYIAMGLGFGIAFSQAAGSATKSGNFPGAFFGWLFGLLGAAFFLAFGGMAVLKCRTAICIRRRRSRVFCMVIAAITCLELPYGTALGVLTFMVLGRESVSRMFASPAPGAAAGSEPVAL